MFNNPKADPRGEEIQTESVESNSKRVKIGN